jgi:hypothetical protein
MVVSGNDSDDHGGSDPYHGGSVLEDKLRLVNERAKAFMASNRLEHMANLAAGSMSGHGQAAPLHTQETQCNLPDHTTGDRAC